MSRAACVRHRVQGILMLLVLLVVPFALMLRCGDGCRYSGDSSQIYGW